MKPLHQIKGEDGRTHLEKLFLGVIAKHIKNFPNGQKRAIFTGGLPASGKSSLITKIVGKNPLFLIDIDKFRHYLPYYEEMAAKDAQQASAFSQKDAGLLAAWSRNLCLKKGKDYILDSVLATPSNVQIEFKRAQEAGYKLEVIYILSSPYISKLRNTYRYLQGVKTNQNVRLVPYSYIDKKYKEMASTIAYILKNYDLADFKIYDSNQKLILDNPKKDFDIENFVKEYIKQEEDKLLKDQSFFDEWEKAIMEASRYDVPKSTLDAIVEEKNKILTNNPFLLKNLINGKEKLDYSNIHEEFADDKERSQFLYIINSVLSEKEKSKKAIQTIFENNPKLLEKFKKIVDKIIEDNRQREVETATVKAILQEEIEEVLEYQSIKKRM